MRRSRLDADRWQELLERQARSDLSLRAFAAREGISPNTLAYGALDRFGRLVEDTWVKDLGTDRAIYDVDLVYDRNSNIVRLDDHVHPTKFDAVYTMDNLDRLVDAQEGDLNGTSSIVTEARQQTWTLTQTGNWANEELDLDGDGTFVDADEHDDTRVHNEVNELEERDLDSNPGTTGDNYTLVYDEAGNLIDDGEAYKYEYDCFYRLRKIYDQTEDLVAEYRYNGLGYRIAEHTDTDTDGDVDGSDAWHHFAHDERWRVVAMFINSATDPEEQYVHHAAGADGLGTASYIDELVLRDRDAVTDINNALDERLYYLQNRHFDVVALVDDTGKQVEMVRYSAYGVPFGLPGGDCDSDGDCDAGDTTDTDQIQAWINAPAYDVRGDMDLDGDVDTADKLMADVGTIGGHAAASTCKNRVAFAGARRLFAHVSVRRRDLFEALGRWMERDAIAYVDGSNLYQAMICNPQTLLDNTGEAPINPRTTGGGLNDGDGVRSDTRVGTPPLPPKDDYFKCTIDCYRMCSKKFWKIWQAIEATDTKIKVVLCKDAGFDTDWLGCTDCRRFTDSATIYLNMDNHLSIERTFLHEMIHAYECATHNDIDHTRVYHMAYEIQEECAASKKKKHCRRCPPLPSSEEVDLECSDIDCEE